MLICKSQARRSHIGNARGYHDLVTAILSSESIGIIHARIEVQKTRQ